eukprot:6201205-Pyramimonas_sp.AAC.1
MKNPREHGGFRRNHVESRGILGISVESCGTPHGSQIILELPTVELECMCFACCRDHGRGVEPSAIGRIETACPTCNREANGSSLYPDALLCFLIKSKPDWSVLKTSQPLRTDRNWLQSIRSGF